MTDWAFHLILPRSLSSNGTCSYQVTRTTGPQCRSIATIAVPHRTACLIAGRSLGRRHRRPRAPARRAGRALVPPLARARAPPELRLYQYTAV